VIGRVDRRAIYFVVVVDDSDTCCAGVAVGEGEDDLIWEGTTVVPSFLDRNGFDPFFGARYIRESASSLLGQSLLARFQRRIISEVI
jgi:hypothetical protein